MASTSQPMRERVTDYIARLQETIVDRLETYCAGQNFRREPWTRDEGGGGLSCTFPLLNISPTDTGQIHPIEKAGVNTSTIYGILPPAAIKQMSTALKDVDKSLPFFVAGLSLIIHPRHPRVPGVHANYRYFEVLDAPLSHDPIISTFNDNGDKPNPQPTVLAWWFGVITDLTPAYVDEPDFRHFHTTLKTACDTWSDAPHTMASVYPAFKASCDDYLYIPHRHEHRGIGGVRFDHMDSDAMRALLHQVADTGTGTSSEQKQQQKDCIVSLSKDTITRLCTQEALFDLVRALGDNFLPSFTAILERRMHAAVVPSERRWQLLRRGRAVEFNLVVDRGTRFGLAAPGIRAENVLVGMPPEARWEYCSELGAEGQDTEEAEMVKVLKKPRSWIGRADAIC